MITKHMFQFHNGTINTLLLSDCIIILFGFNSTTVQLILSYFYFSAGCYWWFQFHNGTINTGAGTLLGGSPFVSIPQRYN